MLMDLKKTQTTSLKWMEMVISNHFLLLMTEILTHLGCINPVNNRINYLSTGAGFQPSTVCKDLVHHPIEVSTIYN